ncbi:MAG: DNA polymerase I [Candidatus Margulisbacteria bacterium]|nr:DNA polymerase I [Candidatus Margulisiibacteriota bacterium]
MLVDGHNLAYRAYFAIPHLKNKEGQPTNAIYGFLNMLFSAIQKENPDYVLVAFDLPAPTFRHKKYALYKANRQKAPEDFKVQVPIIKELILDMGLTIVEKEGFEADDIIGTISKKVQKTSPDVLSYILTGDKDVLQLLDEKTILLLTRKGISEIEKIEEHDVISKFCMKASQVTDYKALKGDPSDNIPGVAGIGEKTALDLIGKFESLDHIYENIDAVSSLKVRQKLLDDKEKAYLSKELATINCDVQIPVHLQPLQLQIQNALPLLNRMELTTIIKKYIPADIHQPPVNDGLNFETLLINNAVLWKELLERLKNAEKVAFYPECSDNKIVGISFAFESAKACYLPLQHKTDNFMLQQHSDLGPMFASSETPLKELKPFFENKKIRKWTHDSKGTTQIMVKNNIQLAGIASDCMLMDYLLNPDRNNHNLDKIVKDYLHIGFTSQKDFLQSFKVKQLEDVTPTDALKHCSAKAWAIFQLQDVLGEALKNQKIDKVYKDIDQPMIDVLLDMERTGIKIDIPYLQGLSSSFHASMEQIEAGVYKEAGQEFNLNSPKQLSDILFKKLNLPSFRKIKTGQSTNVEVLEKLAEQYEIARLIMQYRQVTKLLNTYIDVLPGLADQNQRIHTTYNLTVTATGRLSSSDPNLQNIPIRTAEGEKIRKAFIAEKGNRLIVADYSQIELRILAHISGDEKLQEAFDNDLDIHTATASLIFKVPYADVLPAMRRKAKEINFGISYGMQAYGLSQRLKIGQKEAADFIAVYFATYPKIKEYINSSVEYVRTHGEISTLFGRKRFFSNYNRVGKMEQQALNRMIINTPIQGSAADILKMAMLQIEKKLKELKSSMVLQIHDELIIEAPENEVAKVTAIIKDMMEHVVSLKVPLLVNIGVGNDWLEAK